MAESLPGSFARLAKDPVSEMGQLGQKTRITPGLEARR